MTKKLKNKPNPFSKDHAVSSRLAQLADKSVPLNTRIPLSLMNRINAYLESIPGGKVHGSKTAFVQTVVTQFLDTTKF
jgi:hypothetical protein